jgi:hypothetical protein
MFNCCNKVLMTTETRKRFKQLGKQLRRMRCPEQLIFLLDACFAVLPCEIRIFFLLLCQWENCIVNWKCLLNKYCFYFLTWADFGTLIYLLNALILLLLCDDSNLFWSAIRLKKLYVRVPLRRARGKTGECLLVVLR